MGIWKIVLAVGVAMFLMESVGGAADEAQALLDDFANFDRAYVPALALTKMGTPEASGKAMARLKDQWQEFDAKCHKAMPKDSQWPKDFDRVSRAISEAAKHLADGQQPEAHESLEAIRELLLESRRRNGLDYYLDHLTEFHATMEEIVLAVKVEKPSDLKEDTIESIRGRTRKAIEQWEQVKSAPFQPQRFGFDDKKVAQREQLLKAETQALKKLEEALKEDDKARIISTGMAIKPVFAKNFMLFGDFPKR
jgi:hypothetical protein